MNSETVQIHVTVTRAMKEEIERYAAQTGRSVSSLIRWFIINSLQKEEE